jgi:undecaprenyl-diphosphatase
VASFVSSFYPQTKVPLYVLACLIAYSRVYVGVHFPFDMLGGAALGLAIGFSVAAVARRLFRGGLGGARTKQTGNPTA